MGFIMVFDIWTMIEGEVQLKISRALRKLKVKLIWKLPLEMGAGRPCTSLN